MTEQKSLFLIRHGKSTWGYENVSDMDRPLKNRGIRNAYEMSALLLEKKIQPDLIISSPASRALHTAVIICGQLKCSYNQIRIEELMYFSEEYAILDFIKNTSDAISYLMLVGHNPIISNLANMFFKNQVDYMPTTAVAEFTFETNSWSRISRDKVIHESYNFPEKK